ncbi:MAG: ATPase, T2SS/T4P/T4SS family, partial [Desulfitobacteriaceae bacterium]|nr:ATPase, T2SS/T4P/T4SS family [Desulfitobacteriaceae bacterium]
QGADLKEYTINSQQLLRITGRLMHACLGYGPLEKFFTDPMVMEVVVVTWDNVWLERAGERIKLPPEECFESEEHCRAVLERMLEGTGRQIDLANPRVDARLPDGSRLKAHIPPIAVKGTTITVRRFRKDITAEKLIEIGTISRDLMGWLAKCVYGRLNIAVSGGTASGKTTFCNVLAGYIPKDEWLVTIEDPAELQFDHPCVRALEARPANVEGKGEVTMLMLLMDALRMHPDRIILGEARGPEAFLAINAMNTGHDGCCHPETNVFFVHGVEKIGDFAERVFDGLPVARTDGGIEYVECTEKRFFVNSISDSGKVLAVPVVAVARKPYSGEMKRLRFASGSKLCVTPNHPLYTLKRGEVTQIRADELRPGDFVVSPARVCFDSTPGDEIDYWSGLLHGDGGVYFYKGGNNSVVLTTEEAFIAEEFCSFLKDILGTSANVRVEKHPGPKGRYAVILYGKEEATFVQDLFQVPANCKKDKRVAGIHYVKGLPLFLAGMFDAEGNVNLVANSLDFANANEDFARFFAWGLLSLGIKARIYRKKDTFNVIVYGKENIEKFFSRIPVRYPRKSGDLARLVEKMRNSKSNTNVQIYCRKCLNQPGKEG